MVVIFRAFHIYIWVAFVGFFLPLVVAFTSRNAARFSFLETQDCIRHHSSSSFLRRVTALWVTAVTVVTAIWDTPSHEPSPSPPMTFILSEAARRRIARATALLFPKPESVGGHSPGSPEGSLAHGDFAGQSVVCYTL